MSISVNKYNNFYSLVQYDLDLLDVYIEDDYLDPQYFDVRFLPKHLSYGKHPFNLSTKDTGEYQFVQNSMVLSEFRDSDGKVIFSKIVGPFTDESQYDTGFNQYGPYGTSTFGYVHIDQTPDGTYFDIPDGTATMTIVGELSGVPSEWVDKYNVRLTIPIEIIKSVENNSPLIFNDKPSMDVKIVESAKGGGAREAVPSLIQTFAAVAIDNMSTAGGKVDRVDIDYLSDAGKPTYQLLDRFRIEPTELLTSTSSKIDQWPNDTYTSTNRMSQPGVPIGLFTAYDSDGSMLEQPYNWNRFYGSDDTGTEQSSQSYPAYFSAGYSATSSNGTTILSGSAKLHFSAAQGKDGGVYKLIRRCTDEETFDLKYNISGSARIEIWHTENHSDLLGTNTFDPEISYAGNPNPRLTGSFTLAYSASFIDFNPSGTIDENGIFSEYSGSFMDGNLITSRSSDYTDPVGDDTQIIKDTFTIPSGSWFGIFLSPYSASSGVIEDNWAWMSNISIKHHIKPGENPPFYFNQVELSGFARREEFLDFKSEFYNPAGEAGISILNPLYTHTSSVFDMPYQPEGFSLERGAGEGYSINNGSGGPNQGVSLGAKFQIITTGSFADTYNSAWTYGSASIGLWVEAGHGGPESTSLAPTTFDGVFPGQSEDADSGKLNLYNQHYAYQKGKTIGGFFLAARHSQSRELTTGLMVAAYESSSAGWVTASSADNLFSARFESGDVFIGDNLIISGNIEANEYIISSSTTYYTQSQYNGNTTFGDGCDDIHSFSGSIIQNCGTGTYFSSSNGGVEISGALGAASLDVEGNITASLNVSASSNIYGKNLIAQPNQTVYTDSITANGNNISFNNAVTATGPITASSAISASGVFSQNVHTLTQNNATPSVAAGNLFITNNTSATTITGLTNGVVGQEVTIIVNDSNTDFQDGANFNLFRSLNWTTATTNDVLKMICVDGTKWVSTGRNDNS